MSDLTVTVPETLYVGVQGRKSFCTDTYPLAFATPAGTDKAFDKRKTTVDNWVGAQRAEQARNPDGTGITETVTYEQVTGYNPTRTVTRSYERPVMAEIIPDEYEAQVIKNEPIEGFFFDKSVSRWRTQNKWFAINDPRGFQLQITAENLGDILINNGVVNGDLQGKYVWARSGGKVYLIGETNPAYQKVVNPVVTRKELRAGDRIGNEVFVAKVYLHQFKKIHRYIRISTGEILPEDFRPYSYNYYHSNVNHPGHHSNFRYEYFVVEERDTKPYFLFQLTGGTYNLRRGRPKGPTLAEGQEFTYPSNDQLQRIDFWSSVSAVYGTKAELLSSRYTLQDGIEALYQIDVRDNRTYNQNTEVVRLPALPVDNVYIAPLRVSENLTPS